MTNATAMLTALGDPTRQAIVDRLVDGPMAVGELASTMSISRPAVSQHLKVLKDLGLVTDAKQGTRPAVPGRSRCAGRGAGPPRRVLVTGAGRVRRRPRPTTTLHPNGAGTVITDQGDVRHELLVDMTPEAAWDRFTTRMTEWWPSEHHIGSAPIQEILVEPKVGGRWYTIHTDGSETSTGVVRTWEPPSRLELTWQITAAWEFDPRFITTVAVQFTDAGDGRTLVELEHRGLEAYGDDADGMRTTFDSPGAWPATLAAFGRTTAAQEDAAS